MIYYENEDSLAHLSNGEKLEIVKIEVDKILSINSLLYNALEYNKDEMNTEGYLIASKIIDKAAWNIKKIFL